jgi:hypothetical protein
LAPSQAAAAAAEDKGVSDLASPQGVSPSGSCSTFTHPHLTNTTTHPGTSMDQHWHQHNQQQQQRQGYAGAAAGSQWAPPQQLMDQQQTPGTAGEMTSSQGFGHEPGAGLNPWLHRTASTISSDAAQQQQQLLSPTGRPLMHQFSPSEATLMAAAAAAGAAAAAAAAAGFPPPSPAFHSPTVSSQQQQQQGGQRRRGRGRVGQGVGLPQLEVNGGMDLAANSRLLRTSSGKVLR